MMPDPKTDDAILMPPDSFVKQVKEALEHLYDLQYLQNHPLAQYGVSVAGSSREMAGQRLRRDLVAAMEAFDPGSRVPLHAPDARQYNVLVLRYMENMTVQEMAHEVGISVRQAHRNLRSGEANVAMILWSRRCAGVDGETEGDKAAVLREEVARLGASAQPADLGELLARAVRSVEPLALQKGVRFKIDHTAVRALVLTEPVVAEQALVNLLSRAVGHAEPGQMEIGLGDGQQVVCLSLAYPAQPEDGDTDPLVDSLLAELIRPLGWSLEQQDGPEGDCIVTLTMGDPCALVLVIDDNEGLAALVERYLADQPCQVMGATSSEDGLRLAFQHQPDAIILDIMMPGLNGWEILQRIRNHPQIAQVPVVFCSVITNPELAQALGASGFLPKPLNQVRLLQSLAELGVLRSNSADG